MTVEPRWLSDAEQTLWRLVLGTIRKIDRGMEETLMAGGELSLPEFAVLASLSEAEDKSMRLRELCLELDWDRSRTSHQVTRMDKRGLVQKVRAVGDGRGVVVQITDEGFERLKAAVPDHVESVRRLVFDHLHEEDIPALSRFFEGVMKVNNIPGYPEFVPDEYLGGGVFK